MKRKNKKAPARSIIAAGISVLMLSASGLSVSAEAAYENDVNCLPALTLDTETAEPADSDLWAETGQAEQRSRAVRLIGEGTANVVINGKPYPGEAFILNSVTYVGIREFSMNAGAYSVSWDGKTKTAYVSAKGLDISLSYGSGYMIANGRYFWLGNDAVIEDGTMYVPLRSLCRAFGYSVAWDGVGRRAIVNYGSGPAESGSSFYDGDCVLWLSRIIHAESKGEPLKGKIAVGNVVLNRVGSSLFPNTIYSVIFDMKNGVQFTPAANGTVYNDPSEESITAAKLCLDGAVISNQALFFVNEAIAANSWVSDNRRYIMTIGNHKFFA